MPDRWSYRRAFILGALTTLSLGCVSADAGYADVRDLTASRIHKDVRWHTHDSTAATEDRARQLLQSPIDVEGAVQIALLNNQALQAELEQLGVARSRLVTALRLPNPTVDAALRYGGDGANDPAVDLDALIDITGLLLLPLRGGAADAAFDATRLAVTGRVLDVAFETRVAYYGYQAAEQTLELRRSIVAALGASYAVAEKLHDAGNVTDLNLASEQALYEESRIAFTAAEAEARTRREDLNAWMGLWGQPGADWKLAGRLPSPTHRDLDTSNLEARAAKNSIDLEVHRHRFAAAARTADVRRLSGWLPEVRAGISAERELDGDAGWTVGPAVAIEVPLLYQGVGETGVALAEMRREQRLYADTAIRVRAAARSSGSRLAAAAKSAAYYERVVLPLRQRVVDETQLQFNAMNVGVFQLLQAKRDQIETARAYVESLRSYWVARAEVDQLLAGRLPPRPAGLEAAMPVDGSDESGAPAAP